MEIGTSYEAGQLASAMQHHGRGRVGQRDARPRTGWSADVDVLTCLPQRARLTAGDDRLPTNLLEGEREAVPICVDVNRLKAVNSVLGFNAGDAILGQVLCARAGRQQLLAMDRGGQRDGSVRPV